METTWTSTSTPPSHMNSVLVHEDGFYHEAWWDGEAWYSVGGVQLFPDFWMGIAALPAQKKEVEACL